MWEREYAVRSDLKVKSEFCVGRQEPPRFISMNCQRDEGTWMITRRSIAERHGGLVIPHTVSFRMLEPPISGCMERPVDVNFLPKPAIKTKKH